MKKLIILSAIAMSGFIYSSANAQIGINVGLRFAPRRAPVVVEQAAVYTENDNDDYYYLPDVDAYYDVNAQCYFYFDGNSWISAAYLPGAYRDYDWRNAARYEVRDYRPYLHNDVYRARYSGHVVADWSRRYEDHDQHAYANSTYRNDEHFENRGWFQRQDRFADRQPNHRDEHVNYADPYRHDEHFEARGREGFGQPEQQGRNNAQHFDNREQFSRPSNQNQSHENENRGGSYDRNGQSNTGRHEDQRRGW